MLFLLCLYSVSFLKPRYHILSFLTSNFSECVAAGLFVQRKDYIISNPLFLKLKAELYKAKSPKELSKKFDDG